MMNKRLLLLMSAAALTAALVASTSIGRAAESALEQVVPRAKKADFAANAGRLNGHRSSINPTRGQIPVVGQNGKLASSLGAIGPAGPKGDPGPQGVSGYQRVQENITVPDGNATPDFGVSCPGGRSVLGGGYSFRRNDTDALFVFESRPVSDSTWQFKISNETGGAKPMTLFAVCASTAS